MPAITLMNCLSALLFSFLIGFGFTAGGWLWHKVTS